MTWLTRILLGAALLLGPAILGTAGAQPAPKRVLLLHSFGPHFAPWNTIAKHFREELVRRSPVTIDLYEGSLQNERFGPSRDQATFLEYLRGLFTDRDPDLVIALGAPATRFMQDQRAWFFPASPLVILGADARIFRTQTLGPNDTAVAVDIDIVAQIENLLQLRPDTSRVAIVVGDSPIERLWVDLLRHAFARFEPRVTLEWFNKLSADAMIARAGSMPPRSAIFYGSVRVDAHGVPQETDRVLERMRAQANAPIISYIDTNFGEGVVGGPFLDSREIAVRGAVVAARVLGGEQAGAIRVPAVGLGTPTYDARELKRWNISEARLPPGSVVKFREPTAWERYQWQLLGVLAIVLVQAALIFWLLFERRRRHKAEGSARERLVEVIHLNRSAELGALSSSFAHELGQPLGAIGLNAEAGSLLLRHSPPPLDQIKDILADIRDANQRAGDVLVHMRNLLKRPKPAALADIDLAAVIGDAMQILEPDARKRRITLVTSAPREPIVVRADRIYLQQAVLNLMSNGMDAIDDGDGMRRLTIEAARAEGEQVEVSVTDSGPGIAAGKFQDVFAPFYTTKEQGTGLGLSIARTIVESFGGRIWAENRNGGGAVFRFTLPVRASMRQAAE